LSGKKKNPTTRPDFQSLLTRIDVGIRANHSVREGAEGGAGWGLGEWFMEARQGMAFAEQKGKRSLKESWVLRRRGLPLGKVRNPAR